MFVRNNISCPHCGKSRLADIFISGRAAGELPVLTLTIECSLCLSQKNVSCPVWVMEGLLSLLSRTVQHGRNELSRVSQWRSTSAVYPQRWSAVSRVAEIFFSQGSVDSKFADHYALSLFGAIAWSSGDLCQPCFPWVQFSHRWCPFSKDTRIQS